MNKEEFIKTCVSSGYANPHCAKAYVEKTGKEYFTDQDFVEVHHTSMHWPGIRSCKGLYEAYGVNGKTTAFRNGIAGNSGPGQDWG